MRRVPAPQWQAAADAHRARIDALIGDYLHDRRHGGTHPVVDFLFTYYPYPPAQLRRWHPGFGVILDDPDSPSVPGAPHPYAGLRGYERVVGGARVGDDYLRQRERTVRTTRALLDATASRPARFGCFGLHEWAMVYRTDAPRHRLPLRLGADGTDAVVEVNHLVCTHFDAFRFFTDPARGRNVVELTRERQLAHEQPGCVHATMDLYRVTAKLSPLLHSRLVAESFELAHRAREIDMRASPYDLTSLGYAPIRIETREGRAEYVREQQALTADGSALRARLLARLDALIAQLQGSSGAIVDPPGGMTASLE
ncbi:3-methyladenine DNA glycosylase [Gordonia sp. X0973]|uniref:3-methyladenine DNA glycosylase n=1 Tax=Gordonia sp. X0973 TaxID=2742602 RepID=UPI0026574F42|nr:3-methyladenine DNA glycosylase [Gordonia sp. X0973]